MRHSVRIQRTNAAAHPRADRTHFVAPGVASIPWMVEISGAGRQPAHVPEIESHSKSKADSESHSNVRAKPKEGNVSRCPHWVISRITHYRPRPPAPATAILEPPSVVIRSPSPRLIRHPRPSVVRLLGPPCG